LANSFGQFRYRVGILEINLSRLGVRINLGKSSPDLLFTVLYIIHGHITLGTITACGITNLLNFTDLFLLGLLYRVLKRLPAILTFEAREELLNGTKARKGPLKVIPEHGGLLGLTYRASDLLIRKTLILLIEGDPVLEVLKLVSTGLGLDRGLDGFGFGIELLAIYFLHHVSIVED
jgi:hypothetical protein